MNKYDWLDAIVYINLDRRKDRLQHIQRELEELSGFPSDKIHRQPAFDEFLAGCLRSHKAVIEMAQTRGWKNVLVLEDDFTWRENADDAMQVLKHFWDQHQHEFGFVQLAHMGLAKVGHPKMIEPGVFQVSSATNGAGYLVHSRAYKSLIRVWAAAYMPLAATKAHWKYMNDVVWNWVRKEFPTYVLVPALGYQYRNYSDLAECEVDDQG